MENLIINMVGDIPTVTKSWAAGTVLISILTKAKLIDENKKLYNFDLAFKKGQYWRVIYSLFDYGRLNWISTLDIILSVNYLSSLETSIARKTRFLWMISLLSAILIILSKWAQPLSSLGQLLYANLAYYKKRRDMQANLHRDWISIPLVLSCAAKLFAYPMMHFSLIQLTMEFLPGHLLFFLAEVMSRIYDVDLCEPPTRWFTREQA
ncbi:LAMI_0E07030g1_1 [Lachancea mirantina]|uniref:Derlin n=1 Tax=Lachancea mirantina TaxID=1230905 RepID=A0A1G4JM85_9SACH|nr:LAMI_0E07030g1_1 [Lachancea mirantina]